MSGTYSKSNDYCGLHFAAIYNFYLDRGFEACASLECYLYSGSPPDGAYSEAECYNLLFGSSCQDYVYDVYCDLLKELKNDPKGEMSELLDALSCLQTICSIALWTFRCNLRPELDYFTREFDRLDMQSERLRLLKFSMSEVE